LSGIVIIEGADEKSVSKKLSDLHVSAHVSMPGANTDSQEMVSYETHGPMSMLLKPDGSFRIGGLRAGTAHIQVSSNSEDMTLVRVERDGIVKPEGISIKEGEHVQGLRLVVKQLTGVIRGQVKVEGGELPRGSQIFTSIALIDETMHRSYRSRKVDSRGRFHIQGLAAGRYEVRVNVFGPGVLLNNASDSKEEITVADNTVSEVVLTLKLKNE
jgi:hypothetical protein